MQPSSLLAPGDVLAQDAHEPGDAAESAPQLGDQLLVLGQFRHLLRIGRRHVVRETLGQLGDGEPATDHFLGGPPPGHPRHGPEHQMEVVAHFCAKFDIDGEQAGQLLFPVEDPVPAMGVVCSGVGVAAAEKGARTQRFEQ